MANSQQQAPRQPHWQTWGPAILAAVVVLANQQWIFSQSGSVEQARQMVKVTEFMAMATQKMDELCNRETANRQKDEARDVRLAELETDMARVKQALKMAP